MIVKNQKRTVIAATGAVAAAEAMRQAGIGVCPAFPITPSTDANKHMAQLAADGKIATEFLCMDSEHSAFSAGFGALAAGVRAWFATASQGIIYGHEIMCIISASRMPMLLFVANRAISGPINIHGDHSDAMAVRDSGWIQRFAATVQEVYDFHLMAVRAAEHPDVLLPTMICCDGFTISHSIEQMEMLEDDEARDFVGTYNPPRTILDTDRPYTLGALVLPDSFMELKWQHHEAMAHASRAIAEAGVEFSERFGRTYGHIEPYRLNDAEVAAVVLGSTAGMIMDEVDRLRHEGVKAGMLRIATYRPFPSEEVARTLSHCAAVAVLDRADSLGTQGGPLYGDVAQALYNLPERPALFPYIYGLGGREVRPKEIRESVYGVLTEAAAGKKCDCSCRYIGVRAQGVAIHG